MCCIVNKMKGQKIDLHLDVFWTDLHLWFRIVFYSTLRCSLLWIGASLINWIKLSCCCSLDYFPSYTFILIIAGSTAATWNIETSAWDIHQIRPGPPAGAASLALGAIKLVDRFVEKPTTVPPELANSFPVGAGPGCRPRHPKSTEWNPSLSVGNKKSVFL